jgi:geranylgeranyl reductase family protein
MPQKKYDVIIVGAGPAGSCCAYQLAHSGLSVALLDKSVFPRDKICGDALSADVVNQLYRMNESLAESFKTNVIKEHSTGVRFFAPNHQHLDIAFGKSDSKQLSGYVTTREIFDDFLLQQVKDQAKTAVYLNQKVLRVQNHDDGMTIETENCTFETQMLIGADGANSVVKQLTKEPRDKKAHYCVGLRQYYENVTGFHEGNHIELHFYRELLPGYFWIFPLPGNRANVGLGMLASTVQEKKTDLKVVLRDIINKHPNISPRMIDARPLEDVKGFKLPIGSRKRKISGDRFLLLGDAAGLIDPFTGEGIGNAIRSGRIAAEHIMEAFEKKQFNALFNKKYDQTIYAKMWKELKISRNLQLLLQYPALFDFVVKKARKNSSVQLLLTSMLDNVDIKKELLKPRFYTRLLFS